MKHPNEQYVGGGFPGWALDATLERDIEPLDGLYRDVFHLYFEHPIFVECALRLAHACDMYLSHADVL